MGGSVLSNLKHLEIIRWFVKEQIKLSLPKLKILAFHQPEKGFLGLSCTYSVLTIDCPMLSVLAFPKEGYQNENLLDIKRPDTIKKLQTSMFGQELAPFKNVEHLVTNKLKVLNTSTLRLLPKLQELHYSVSIQKAIHVFKFRGSRFEKVIQMKRKLKEFIKGAKKTRANFQFSFCGFPLDKMNVDEIDFGFQFQDERAKASNEYVYASNFHLLVPTKLDFIADINYTLLASLDGVPERVWKSLPEKFTHIHVVRTDCKIEDQNHFLRFLKSLRCLQKLYLFSSQLSQEFYEKLPESAYFLNQLEMGDSYQNRNPLNFDFIENFSHLTQLSILCDVPRESKISLIKHIDKLSKISLRSGAETITIYKIGSNIFRIKNGLGRFETLNLEKATLTKRLEIAYSM